MNPLLQMRQVRLGEVKSFSELGALDMVFESRFFAPRCCAFPALLLSEGGKDTWSSTSSVPAVLRASSHLILAVAPGGRSHHPHFVNKVPEIQGGQVTCQDHPTNR